MRGGRGSENGQFLMSSFLDNPKTGGWFSTIIFGGGREVPGGVS